MSRLLHNEMIDVVGIEPGQKWDEYLIQRNRIIEFAMWHAFARLDEEQMKRVIELTREEKQKS